MAMHMTDGSFENAICSKRMYSLKMLMSKAGTFNPNPAPLHAPAAFLSQQSD